PARPPRGGRAGWLTSGTQNPIVRTGNLRLHALPRSACAHRKGVPPPHPSSASPVLRVPQWIAAGGGSPPFPISETVDARTRATPPARPCRGRVPVPGLPGHRAAWRGRLGRRGAHGAVAGGRGRAVAEYRARRGVADAGPRPAA